jgi:nitrous oxidase accessory protein
MIFVYDAPTNTTIWIEFNFTQIPRNAEILNATLNMFHIFDDNTAHTGETYGIFGVDNNTLEDLCSFGGDYCPRKNLKYLNSKAVSASTGAYWESFNVTDWVSNRTKTNFNNITFMINRSYNPASTPSHSCTFASSENTTHYPSLEVVYQSDNENITGCYEIPGNNKKYYINNSFNITTNNCILINEKQNITLEGYNKRIGNIGHKNTSLYIKNSKNISIFNMQFYNTSGYNVDYTFNIDSSNKLNIINITTNYTQFTILQTYLENSSFNNLKGFNLVNNDVFVYLYQLKNVSFNNLYFNGTTDYGIEISTMKNSYFNNINFSKASFNNDAIWLFGANINDVTNITINNLTATDSSYGINIQGVNNLLINNSKLFGMNYNAILLYNTPSTDFGTGKIRIENTNISDNCLNCLVYFLDLDYNNYGENVCKYEFSNVTVSENRKLNYYNSTQNFQNIENLNFTILCDANNTLINNITLNHKKGQLLIYNSYNISISNSSFINTSSPMIVVSFANISFFNNYFNILNRSSTNNYIYNYVTWHNNKLNKSLQLGNRIYGVGKFIGGNYWTNYLSTGFSDTCIDSDKNGICDTNYTLSGSPNNMTDFYPLSDEGDYPRQIDCGFNQVFTASDDYITNDNLSFINSGNVTILGTFKYNKYVIYKPCRVILKDGGKLR